MSVMLCVVRVIACELVMSYHNCADAGKVGMVRNRDGEDINNKESYVDV